MAKNVNDKIRKLSPLQRQKIENRLLELAAENMGWKNNRAHGVIIHKTILQEAEELVGVDRNARYGHPKIAFAQIARLWSEVLGVPVTPQQVALCMIAMKFCRIIQKPHHRDSIVDLCGYAKIFEMIQEKD